MKKWLLCGFLWVVLGTAIMADSTDLTQSNLFFDTGTRLTNPALLPNISLVGSFYGGLATQASANLSLGELEFAFQNYVYPGVRADVFVAVESEDNETKIEVEEAALHFSEISQRMGASAGKRLIPFGKRNAIHSELWPVSTRPLALSEFLGEEGLKGEGGSLSYLLPFSFFAQLEVGLWRASSPEDNQPFFGNFSHIRAWGSRELSELSEIDWGINTAFPLEKEGRQSSLWAVDIQYQRVLTGGRRIRMTAEAIHIMQQDDPTAESKNRWGGYGYVGYRPTRYWEVGAQADYVQLMSEDSVQQLSAVLTHHLNETLFWRTQYSWKPKTGEHQLIAQLTFGMGPHGHTLQ